MRTVKTKVSLAYARNARDDLAKRRWPVAAGTARHGRISGKIVKWRVVGAVPSMAGAVVKNANGSE